MAKLIVSGIERRYDGDPDMPPCGYCQPGPIMQAASLLKDTPDPSDEDIDTVMSGNLCRCETCPRIRVAINSV
jgi:isoquinoline 1-oxidoreductase alpha subunit